MKYWVLADTHFGHDKMTEYCGRPDNFESIILQNINDTVSDDDVLIHLGDFCIYKDEVWHREFMKVCSCKKWLIRGNHDRKSMGWYFSHGWDFVGDMAWMTIFGADIMFSHKPVDWPLPFINVHGHEHNTRHHEIDTDDRHKLVYLEHDYKPIDLRKIVEPSK
jgi:calcineurin-like phosphoesterase family protein